MGEEPPFDPEQVHDQGLPEPETDGVELSEQRLEEGAELKIWLAEEPQTPSTLRVAEQEAFPPVFAPSQVHVQGPVPETELAVPALQRSEEGVV